MLYLRLYHYLTIEVALELLLNFVQASNLFVFIDSKSPKKLWFCTPQMLTALRKCPNSMYMGNLKDCIDHNLRDLYPHDCAYKV